MGSYAPFGVMPPISIYKIALSMLLNISKILSLWMVYDTQSSSNVWGYQNNYIQMKWKRECHLITTIITVHDLICMAIMIKIIPMVVTKKFTFCHMTQHPPLKTPRWETGDAFPCEKLINHKRHCSQTQPMHVRYILFKIKPPKLNDKNNNNDKETYILS